MSKLFDGYASAWKIIGEQSREMWIILLLEKIGMKKRLGMGCYWWCNWAVNFVDLNAILKISIVAFLMSFMVTFYTRLKDSNCVYKKFSSLP